MWARRIGMIFSVAALMAAAYLYWTWTRVDEETAMTDPAWPRPWPYPDQWANDYFERPGDIADVSLMCLVVAPLGLLPWIRWRPGRRPVTEASLREDYGDPPTT